MYSSLPLCVFTSPGGVPHCHVQSLGCSGGLLFLLCAKDLIMCAFSHSCVSVPNNFQKGGKRIGLWGAVHECTPLHPVVPHCHVQSRIGHQSRSNGLGRGWGLSICTFSYRLSSPSTVLKRIGQYHMYIDLRSCFSFQY